jgi:hypothetical protein
MADGAPQLETLALTLRTVMDQLATLTQQLTDVQKARQADRLADKQRRADRLADKRSEKAATQLLLLDCLNGQKGEAYPQWQRLEDVEVYTEQFWAHLQWLTEPRTAREWAATQLRLFGTQLGQDLGGNLPKFLQLAVIHPQPVGEGQLLHAYLCVAATELDPTTGAEHETLIHVGDYLAACGLEVEALMVQAEEIGKSWPSVGPFFSALVTVLESLAQLGQNETAATSATRQKRHPHFDASTHSPLTGLGQVCDSWPGCLPLGGSN